MSIWTRIGEEFNDVRSEAATSLGAVASALAAKQDVPTRTGVASIYVDAVNGSDGNQGKSWTLAKKTLSGALSAAGSMAGSAVVHLSTDINARHDIAETLVIPQGVELVGLRTPHGTQGARLRWIGPDDGSYMIRTAGDSSGSDWTSGLLQNLELGVADSKPGGGSYDNVNGIYGRNLQNNAVMRDLWIRNLPGKGLYADSVNNAVPLTGFPGYVTFERIWITGCDVNWHMRGGFTSVLFNMCAGDVSANTTDVFIIDPMNVDTFGGRNGQYTFIGFKSEDNGDDVDNDGETRYFTVNTDIDLTFIGSSGKKGYAGTKPWINYTVPRGGQNAVAGAIPVTLQGCHTSNIPVTVQGPDGKTWLAPAVGSGGQAFAITSWSGHAAAPKKWTGTHSGFASDGVAVTGADPAAAALRVSSAPGATVPPVEFAAPVFAHTFTAADSTSAIPASDTGATGTAAVGTWGISGNKAYLVSATHKADYTWAGTAADGVLYADLTASPTGQARFGLSFRRTDTNNRLNIYYKSTTGELILEKHASGTPSGLKAATASWAAGATKRLAVSMIGPVITASLDGVQVLTHTLAGGDATAYGTATGFGLSANGNTTADANADNLGSRWDNVSFVATVVRINTAGALQVLSSGVWTAVSTGNVAGALLAANNLSDVASPSIARTSLGLGTAATQPSSAFDAAGTATAAQAFAIQRGNHTGTQSADTVTDGTTNKAYTATEKTKLGGIATGATANATDAQLRDRATHTGTQAASTITGLATVATSGAYTDLSGKPTIPATAADVGALAVANNLSDVASTVSARLNLAAASTRTNGIAAETVPRAGFTTQSPTAGVVHIARISLKGGNYTTVTVCPTVAGVSLTNAFFGLYDVSTLGLLATSSSAVTALQTAAGGATPPPTVAMSYTVSTPGDYYIALLVGGGTTMPTLVTSAIQAAVLVALPPVVAQRHTTGAQTSLPATLTLATSPASIILPWLRYE